MTPEERFTRMENLLQAMMAHQAKQQEQIDKHTEQIRAQSAEIDKHNAGIRDLIVVSRTLLDSIQELREAQATTDENLNILIDTVDRIVRRRESTE